MAGAMNRISYFTPTKNREGLAVGPVSDEQLNTLLRTIQEARDSGKGIVFFLWKNEPNPELNRKSIATLTVAVAQDRPQYNATGRKPIANTAAPAPPKNDPLKDLLGGNPKQAKGW